MNIGAKVWWKKLNSTEKKAVIVFGVFIAGIAIFLSGIKIGQIIGTVLNML